jgi:multicomponent Na+:H+ antiporter subunit A
VFSFIGKELLLEAVLESPRARLLFTFSTVLAGALFAAAAGIVGVRPFFGAFKETPKPPHEAPPALLAGPALLAALGLVIGFFPGTVSSLLVSPAVAAVLGHPEPVKLALWHGFNEALALSAASLAGGVALYYFWEGLRRATSRLERFLAWGPERLYQAGLVLLARGSEGLTSVLQSGYLRYYVLTVIAAAAALGAYPLVTARELVLPLELKDIRPHELVLAALIPAAALMAVLSRSRLAAIAALGVVGYSVALLFLLFGAPDLAMTQFLIETLTVILFVLVFYHLPPIVRRTVPTARARDALFAASAGALMTLLVLLASAVDPHPSLADFYARQSVPAAHGRNIVNVILVDFRALDTLGEITVLGTAAAGVYALLKLRMCGKERRRR